MRCINAGEGNMKSIEITKLLDSYIEDMGQRGCFLIKGVWGVGKTYFINKYIDDCINKCKASKTEIKFIKISLFDKDEVSQITSEINSKLISSREAFIKNLIKIPIGVSALSVGVNFDFTSLLSEKCQLEKNKASKARIVFIFDDLERTKICTDKVLGYVNDINENDGFKVVVIANTDAIKDGEAFENYKEKVFYTEVLFSENFSEIARNIICKWENLKAYEEKIIEPFSHVKHDNLRTLIFAIQKIEQIVDGCDCLLDEYVLTRLINTIIGCSIRRTMPTAEDSENEKRNDIRAMVSEMSKCNILIHENGMVFLEPFVNNEDYSLDAIVGKIKAIQQAAVEDKNNPIHLLQEEWFYESDDKSEITIEETAKWIKDKTNAIPEYPNILVTIQKDRFIRKLKMFRNVDEYLDQIVELMKSNIRKLDFFELDGLQSDISRILLWPNIDPKGYIRQLTTEIDVIREESLMRAFDCDSLFDRENPDGYDLMKKIADIKKDVLDICSPEMIVDRVRKEEDLRSIENARFMLLEFYRSYYHPVPDVDHKKSLKENENVKMLINLLYEYLKQGDPSKSKRFHIETMISNLDGTCF
jgi:hypothetical protein